jgi:hypothetical protein
MEQTSHTSGTGTETSCMREIFGQYTHPSATYYISTEEFLRKIGFTYEVKRPRQDLQTINVEIQYKLTTPLQNP